jgi:2-polyprenyl-6-methoxyphenol hydroxylase-like FAD-dependent oxidoreductase
MKKLKVLVSGAGMGGLCLAQALRRADIDVAVFERDEHAGQRPQGYRLHIESDGADALRESLPPPLHALFEATGVRPRPFTTILGPELVEQVRIDVDRQERHASTAGTPLTHLNVNRATLRQILMLGLEDVVRFGATLSHYENDADGVTAFFTDGTGARGDLLVGADGIQSPVRRQRLPLARTQDTELRVVYGRIPIDRARALLPEQALADVFAVAKDEKKRFVGMGTVIFPTIPSAAAARLSPGAHLDDPGDFVTCIVGARRERWDLDDAVMRRATGEELCAATLRLLADWPESSRAILRAVDPRSPFFIEMYTSVPCGPFASSNVTLLGDAIHAMSPILGRGANMALRDASLLASHLVMVAEDKCDLLSAVAAYEAEMLRYGFDTVRRSAAAGAQIVGQAPLLDDAIRS